MAKVIRQANGWMDKFERKMGIWAEKIFQSNYFYLDLLSPFYPNVKDDSLEIDTLKKERIVRLPSYQVFASCYIIFW